MTATQLQSFECKNGSKNKGRKRIKKGCHYDKTRYVVDHHKKKTILENEIDKKITKIPPPVGLEPTTFELEVQHASPLRHGGGPLEVNSIFLY